MSFCRLCGREDSNLHPITGTSPSNWRVYHSTTSAFVGTLWVEQRPLDFQSSEQTTTYTICPFKKKISHFLDWCEMSFRLSISDLTFLTFLHSGLPLSWWHTHTFLSELFPETVTTGLARQSNKTGMCIHCHHIIWKYLCKFNFCYPDWIRTSDSLHIVPDDPLLGNRWVICVRITTHKDRVYSFTATSTTLFF